MGGGGGGGGGGVHCVGVCVCGCVCGMWGCVCVCVCVCVCMHVREWCECMSSDLEHYLAPQARHKEEVEQIRSGGHDALALIVEEYKVGTPTQCCALWYPHPHLLLITPSLLPYHPALTSSLDLSLTPHPFIPSQELSRVTVEQERERSEKLLNEAITKETERCEQLLKEQHERLTAALEEERERQEERVGETMRKAQEEHKVGEGRGGGEGRGEEEVMVEV